MPGGRILLTRHGETPASRRRLVLGRRELQLTERGRRQAERLADAVAGTGIVGLYASPSGRTMQTAAIVGARMGLETIVEGRLTETHTGRGEGRRRAEGEALVEHQRRVRGALHDIARGPLPALLVCDAGTIRVALALGLEGGLAAAREISVPSAEPIAFDERLVLTETR